MLDIKETIIVEGKYDLIRLKGFVSSAIITTEGFRVFADKEKQFLIRRLAQTNGIILMTDPDSAGQVIRGFLNGIADKSRVKNCYVPGISGVEKRKSSPSKEGVLGVEGLSEEVLEKALINCGATISGRDSKTFKNPITKLDLYELGLSGRENSAFLRAKLLKELGFPKYLSANAMLCALNCLYSKQEIVDKLENMDYNQ